MTTSALTVELDDVTRTFAQRDADRVVLSDVDLRVGAAEIVAILGPSGCGKSTLLRLIAGLDSADGGSVRIAGEAVRAADQRVAVAFQEPRLLPWRTITRNVALGLPDHGRSAAGLARVAELLDLVGLRDAAELRPRQVSGGMAQRASLARALAREPGVLVLDEPFGALDALTRLSMQELLLDVHRAEPRTIVLVTHDVDEALHLADRVVLLGPGVTAEGSTVVSLVTVPGERPRDRGAADLAELRAELLEGLGVPRRHTDASAPLPSHALHTVDQEVLA
ncbi:ABC transporter ATP-binding protein [Agrococcus beijingensis]|uniref:ABC transporter ATP-binding protein n=1 Tax=Agrococcus beijingensis TaxID=3068634 RepID=UPI002740821F|nr:ABC transporter ATP-binding protein [Agrococcus sp. REN33]